MTTSKFNLIPLLQTHSRTGKVFSFLVGVCCLALSMALSSLGAQTEPWDGSKATLVLYNASFPDSKELAQEYAQLRGIPENQLLGLNCSHAETLSRSQYQSEIRDPLISFFLNNKLWTLSDSSQITSSKIAYLVLMHGMPYRVQDPPSSPDEKVAPLKEKSASVDSELSILGLLGVSNPTDRTEGPLKNPYFKQDRPFPVFRGPPILLVGRLDGPSAEIVRRMMRDSVEVESQGLWGKAYIDFDSSMRKEGYQMGEDWLQRAAERMIQVGIPPVTEHHASEFPTDYPMPDLIFYLGWYGTDAGGNFAPGSDPAWKMSPGAIACHLHSYSAQFPRQTELRWTGALLQRGAAVTFGHVEEPYLPFCIHFDILVDRLLKGYSLGEAASMATPAHSWMNVVFGDPLYRPFRTLSKPSSEPAESKDPVQTYQVVRQLAATHAEASPEQFYRAVLQHGKEKRSALILEILGLFHNAKKETQSAMDLFENALSFSTSPEERLRLQVHTLEILRNLGQKQEARDRLLKLQEEHRPKTPKHWILDRIQEAMDQEESS